MSLHMGMRIDDCHLSQVWVKCEITLSFVIFQGGYLLHVRLYESLFPPALRKI